MFLHEINPIELNIQKALSVLMACFFSNSLIHGPQGKWILKFEDIIFQHMLPVLQQAINCTNHESLNSAYCQQPSLTHWGRGTHICISKLNSIVSDNGLAPSRRQAIIQTNAGILSIGPPGTNFSKILIEIHIFSFKKMHLKMASGKWRASCFSLNVINYI